MSDATRSTRYVYRDRPTWVMETDMASNCLCQQAMTPMIAQTIILYLSVTTTDALVPVKSDASHCPVLCLETKN